MNAGKIFEKDFKDSMPINVWYYRFRDSPATYDLNECQKCPINKKKPVRFSTKNICDCEVYKFPNLFLFELKSTKQKSLPFSMITQNQIDSLTEASKFKGIKAGLVVNFRELDETYFMPIVGFNYFHNTLISKSIPIKVFRENCYKIRQAKLRSHYRYDISNFLKTMSNEKQDFSIRHRNNRLFD